MLREYEVFFLFYLDKLTPCDKEGQVHRCDMMSVQSGGTVFIQSGSRPFFTEAILFHNRKRISVNNGGDHDLNSVWPVLLLLLCMLIAHWDT